MRCPDPGAKDFYRAIRRSLKDGRRAWAVRARALQHPFSRQIQTTQIKPRPRISNVGADRPPPQGPDLVRRQTHSQGRGVACLTSPGPPRCRAGKAQRTRHPYRLFATGLHLPRYSRRGARKTTFFAEVYRDGSVPAEQAVLWAAPPELVGEVLRDAGGSAG